MAFGIASGMGILAGLYVAVAMCLIGRIFGGTRTQISGPNGTNDRRDDCSDCKRMPDGNIAQALVIVVFAGRDPSASWFIAYRSICCIYTLCRDIRIYDWDRFDYCASTSSTNSWRAHT